MRAIRGDYSRHEKACKTKFGDWLGWKYFLMDGRTEITEQMLPKRKHRGTNVNLRKKDEHKEDDPQLDGWRLLKKEDWTCNQKLRKAGFEYVVEMLHINGMSFNAIYNIVEALDNKYAAEEE